MEYKLENSLNNVTGFNVSINGNSDGTDIDPSVKKTLDILLVVIMAIVMLSLGCTVELAHLKSELKRPIGMCIGMFCQFIIFPPIAFGLAHALQLKQYDALGMVMLATCPGGHISNIATYWSNGDVALSVSMTAASTAIGTGIMPLNLWIYSRNWTSKTASIPYLNIVIALVLILVPASIGVLILMKLPKAAKWIAKSPCFVPSVHIALRNLGCKLSLIKFYIFICITNILLIKKTA
ncbi:hypothetical protein KUTeg_020521 [Tegillarca granosa]|uniref:Uncharacterized protein n=1 Tax=Tegillarca granosa TaxID=220873 RepID=A0ABQ9E847_TEGGR|nr:hypothetical protein KUTeg_020521 [Tegillarca granosa]